jgi:hypothetical protein
MEGDMYMLREVLMGTAAGAAGTVALNVTTYADMVVRARPSSSVPSQVAGKLAEKAGIDLGSDDAATNRKSGLGALMGYVTGLGVGTAYGLVRPHLDDVSVPLASVGLGLAAMAGSDVPATALGVTDPTTWPASSWVSDAVPHLAYGLVTAVAYEAFSGA